MTWYEIAMLAVGVWLAFGLLLMRHELRRAPEMEHHI